MITYPISSNWCKKNFSAMLSALQFSIFQKEHWKCSVRKSVCKILQNSQENTCSKVSFLIKLQAEVTASDLSCVFSWRFLVFFISTEKWDEKREIPRWSSNIYFFARASICLMSKISKEIWQMVIWSQNLFKENMMLQFSWLEEFR